MDTKNIPNKEDVLDEKKDDIQEKQQIIDNNNNNQKEQVNSGNINVDKTIFVQNKNEINYVKDALKLTDKLTNDMYDRFKKENKIKDDEKKENEDVVVNTGDNNNKYDRYNKFKIKYSKWFNWKYGE